VTESEVEPTNNRAERALRELVVQRKIIGTLKNEKGIFIRDLLTLLATWSSGVWTRMVSCPGPKGSLARDGGEREKLPTDGLIRTLILL
jgi:hypothetical protein